MYSRLKYPITLFFLLLGQALSAQETLSRFDRPRLDGQEVKSFLSVSFLQEIFVGLLILVGVVWLVYLIGAWRLTVDPVRSGSDSSKTSPRKLEPSRSYRLPLPDLSPIGLDPYGAEGFHSRLMAANHPAEAPAERSREEPRNRGTDEGE